MMRTKQLGAWVLCLHSLVGYAVGVSLAQEGKPVPGEVVADDLFEGLPAAKKTEPQPVPSPAVEAGEDLDFGSAQDPFAEVARKMQKSQAMLEKRELTEAAKTLRGEIVSDLDKLLNKMQKQCSQGQCNKPGGSKQPGGASQAGEASKKPATESTARLGKPGSQTSETRTEAELIREVWGHLPPKLREAMQNAALEEYLPKYEQHIREYYRRLAEENRASK